MESTEFDGMSRVILKSIRGEKGINEYTNNDKIYVEGLPHLLPLGEFFPGRFNTLTAREIRHLLYYEDGRFLADELLIFIVADQMRRHATNAKLSLYFNKKTKELNELQEFLAKPNCRQLMQSYIINPKLKDAKILFKMLSDVTSMNLGQMPFQHNSSSINKMYSLSLSYGKNKFNFST